MVGVVGSLEGYSSNARQGKPPHTSMM
jgi:hypothetical protein